MEKPGLKEEKGGVFETFYVQILAFGSEIPTISGKRRAGIA